MKPPMHDPITYRQPLVVNGETRKDGRGFPIVTTYEVMARVSDGTDMIINRDGQEVRSTYSIALPKQITPRIQDEIEVDGQKVTIQKIKPRKSWSGKNIYYWVVECGA